MEAMLTDLAALAPPLFMAVLFCAVLVVAFRATDGKSRTSRSSENPPTSEPLHGEDPRL